MGNIDKAVSDCNKVKAVYERLINEKTNRIEGMKNDLQKQLDETNGRIRGEEDIIANLESQSSKVRSEGAKLKGEVAQLEQQLEACEEDKMTKDNQIRTLKEEIAHQEELISRLQKEKKGVGESRQKN